MARNQKYLAALGLMDTPRKQKPPPPPKPPTARVLRSGAPTVAAEVMAAVQRLIGDLEILEEAAAVGERASAHRAMVSVECAARLRNPLVATEAAVCFRRWADAQLPADAQQMLFSIRAVARHPPVLLAAIADAVRLCAPPSGAVVLRLGRTSLPPEVQALLAYDGLSVPSFGPMLSALEGTAEAAAFAERIDLQQVSFRAFYSAQHGRLDWDLGATASECLAIAKELEHARHLQTVGVVSAHLIEHEDTCVHVCMCACVHAPVHT